MEFIEAILNNNVPFIRNAIFASLLSSILFGVIGSIVSVKRISGLAGAISHAILGGVGIGLFLASNKIISNFSPILGAIIFAIITAVIIGVISIKAKQREDTVINALWAIGMSIGIVFIAKTPEYVDPMSYLFGNILLISDLNLFLIFIMDILVILLTYRYYRQIQAITFDEEFARVRGINTNLIFIILLIITAISIVLLQTFVGIVMVIAMLTIPVGVAFHFSKNLFGLMIFSSIFSFLFSIFGLIISWLLDLPAGAVIVLFAGVVYFLVSLFKLRK
ncbi:MAG: metal ABC transporter permease [Brevinematales bacterium]|nr:metal ABC transporter permease [Brevinematales bacterium]